MLELTNQTAIVTGGATGIGEAVAVRLRSAGAQVVLVDIDFNLAQIVADGLGNGSYALQADVSCPSDTDSVIRAVLERSGGIQIVVNNAGIVGPVKFLWDITDNDWARTLAVNLTGVFNMCRATAPYMRTAKYGRIVNLASIAGKEGNPGMAAYSASKAAVIALTKSLGKELATEGICVNAVAPAVVKTKILDQVTANQIKYMTDRIPMKRLGTPQEIAAVVHFLCSADCSFVTGQCYDASGGRATY